MEQSLHWGENTSPYRGLRGLPGKVLKKKLPTRAVLGYTLHQRSHSIQMRVGAEHEIHIEQLKVRARVGVSTAERSKPQRLVLNITVWPARDLRDVKDAVARTVDYALLCQAIKKYLASQTPKLLETLGKDLTAHLLGKFRIRKICLEIRKFVLPDAAYASVTVTRRASLD